MLTCNKQHTLWPPFSVSFSASSTIVFSPIVFAPRHTPVAVMTTLALRHHDMMLYSMCM